MNEHHHTYNEIRHAYYESSYHSKFRRIQNTYDKRQSAIKRREKINLIAGFIIVAATYAIVGTLIYMVWA